MRHLIPDRGAPEAMNPIFIPNTAPADQRDLLAAYKALLADLSRFVHRPSGEHLAAIEARMAALLVAHDAEAVGGLVEAFQANPRRFQRPATRGVPELVAVDALAVQDDGED